MWPSSPQLYFTGFFEPPPLSGHAPPHSCGFCSVMALFVQARIKCPSSPHAWHLRPSPARVAPTPYSSPWSSLCMFYALIVHRDTMHNQCIKHAIAIYTPVMQDQCKIHTVVTYLRHARSMHDTYNCYIIVTCNSSRTIYDTCMKQYAIVQEPYMTLA